MSNGILIMGWIPSNMIAPGQSYAAGAAIPMVIPNGYGAPSFTQTPFNVQYAVTYTAATAINTSIVAAVAASPTVINVYNAYALSGTSGPNVFAGNFMFAIGV